MSRLENFKIDNEDKNFKDLNLNNLEFRNKSCGFKFHIIVLIHHYLAGFLYYGPLFFSNISIIHLIIVISTLIHWQLNNNKCYVPFRHRLLLYINFFFGTIYYIVEYLLCKYTKFHKNPF